MTTVSPARQMVHAPIGIARMGQRHRSKWCRWVVKWSSERLIARLRVMNEVDCSWYRPDLRASIRRTNTALGFQIKMRVGWKGDPSSKMDGEVRKR